MTIYTFNSQIIVLYMPVVLNIQKFYFRIQRQLCNFHENKMISNKLGNIFVDSALRFLSNNHLTYSAITLAYSDVLKVADIISGSEHMVKLVFNISVIAFCFVLLSDSALKVFHCRYYRVREILSLFMLCTRQTILTWYTEVNWNRNVPKKNFVVHTL
jgi:hypothetical protein